MRLFVTLCCLAAVTYAKPQYNYATGISGSNNLANTGGFSSGGGGYSSSGGGYSGGGGGYSGGNTVYSGSGTGYSGGGSTGGSNSFGLQQNNFNTGSTSNGLNINGQGGLQRGESFSSRTTQFTSSSSTNNQNFQGHQNHQSQNHEESLGFGEPIVHKQIFTFGAPEDQEKLEQTKRLLIGRPQTNYRVIFIKAPASSSANVKLSAEYAPKEEKTIIYVLTKKESELEVGEIATPAPTQPSKPEVHFIKYRTEQEAEFAQTKLAAEYDKIKGTSENINGGIAQERSFIGTLQTERVDLNQNFESSASDEASVSIGVDHQSSGSSTNENKVYLPPSSQ